MNFFRIFAAETTNKQANHDEKSLLLLIFSYFHNFPFFADDKYHD